MSLFPVDVVEEARGVPTIKGMHQPSKFLVHPHVFLVVRVSHRKFPNHPHFQKSRCPIHHPNFELIIKRKKGPGSFFQSFNHQNYSPSFELVDRCAEC